MAPEIAKSSMEQIYAPSAKSWKLATIYTSVTTAELLTVGIKTGTNSNNPSSATDCPTYSGLTLGATYDNGQLDKGKIDL